MSGTGDEPMTSVVGGRLLDNWVTDIFTYIYTVYLHLYDPQEVAGSVALETNILIIIQST